MGNCNHFCNAADPEPLSKLDNAEIEKKIKAEIEKKTPGSQSIIRANSDEKLQLDSRRNFKKKGFYANGTLYTPSEEENHEDQKSTATRKTDLQTNKKEKIMNSNKKIDKIYETLNTNTKENKNMDLPKQLTNFATQTSDLPKGIGNKQKTIEKKTTSKGKKIINSTIVYEGDLKDGKREGLGVQKWPEGTIYEGEWKNDRAQGKGKLKHRGGDVYEGEWCNDKANGFGIYINPNGGNYEGEWSNDMQHGKGHEKWPDGSSYEGEFKFGQKHGKGKIIFPEGSSYEGDFNENTIEGSGKYIWNDGKSYIGQWHQNKMHGKGEFVWEDGKKYIGEFQNDRKHGLGKLIEKKGNMFYGFWKNDLKNGKGIIVDKTGKIEEFAEWKEGVKSQNIEKGNQKGFEVLLNKIKEDQKEIKNQI